MINVLVVDANGQLGCNTTRVLLRDASAKLTLSLRPGGLTLDEEITWCRRTPCPIRS